MNKRERARRSCRISPVESLETRSLMTIAATAPLPAVTAAPGATVAAVNLDSYFKDPAPAANYAIFNTTLGTIPVLLTPQTTPQTVANFLNYVNKGDYSDTIVHRSVPGFIWQAGGYQVSSSGNVQPITANAAVKNEFGASNVRGTIAMAKLGSDPNSATDEFFFNESDSNASNLDNQNSGFTVFGHVVGPQGLAVMDAIAAVPVPSPGPLTSPLDEIPLQNYTSGASVKASNLIIIGSITQASDVYTTVSDTPSVATATVSGSNLTITPVAAGTAHIAIVAYGSDGVPATETFTVNVAGTPVTPTPTPTTTPTPTPTTTPTPTATTPTTTPVTTAQPVATTPASDFALVARGALPASVVAGQKAKIQQTVTLTDPAAAVTQKERVAMSLSADSTGSAGAYEIASTSANVKVKAGKPAKLTLSARQISSSVPAGTYHVLVSVTDPDGAMTTVDTGRTLTVRTSQAKKTAK